MKYIEQYLKEELHIKVLGAITVKEDDRFEISGEEILADGNYTGVWVSHVDYCNWLENKLDKMNITIE